MRRPRPHVADAELARLLGRDVLLLGVDERPDLVALDPLRSHVADHRIVELRAGGAEFRNNLTSGRWSNARARGYKRGAKIHNPFQLRLNAYRVLLTRGRDACVVFVPQLQELDEKRPPT